MKRQITKSYLEYLGVIDVTTDGKVMTKNGERKTKPEKYIRIQFNDRSKYQSVKKEKRNDSSGIVDILLHNVVYAWFNGEVPYDKEIHHKDGNKLNNSIDNLVALTKEEHRKEHLKMKAEKAMEEIKEEKCRLDIPRDHYVKKIEQYTLEKNYSGAAQYKRRLKYFDNHIEEHNAIMKLTRDLGIIRYFKNEYRKAGNKARWHQFCDLEKHWKEYSDEIREQIMNCILKF